jgi:hypothetical protein
LNESRNGDEEKRRSADSRDSRKTRASSAAAVRGAIRRSGAARRSAATAPFRASLFQTPIDFTSSARSAQWDPRSRAENVSLSPRNGHVETLFSRKMSASKRRFRAIESRKIAKLVLNAFKTQVVMARMGGSSSNERFRPPCAHVKAFFQSLRIAQ